MDQGEGRRRSWLSVFPWCSFFIVAHKGYNLISLIRVERFACLHVLRARFADGLFFLWGYTERRASFARRTRTTSSASLSLSLFECLLQKVTAGQRLCRQVLNTNGTQTRRLVQGRPTLSHLPPPDERKAESTRGTKLTARDPARKLQRRQCRTVVNDTTKITRGRGREGVRSSQVGVVRGGGKGLFLDRVELTSGNLPPLEFGSLSMPHPAAGFPLTLLLSSLLSVPHRGVCLTRSFCLFICGRHHQRYTPTSQPKRAPQTASASPTAGSTHSSCLYLVDETLINFTHSMSAQFQNSSG